jgi:hypothetical protein
MYSLAGAVFAVSIMECSGQQQHHQEGTVVLRAALTAVAAARLLTGDRQCLGPAVGLLPTTSSACAAADVSASSTRSSSNSPVAMDQSVEEALHIVEESLHERAAVSGVGCDAGNRQTQAAAAAVHCVTVVANRLLPTPKGQALSLWWLKVQHVLRSGPATIMDRHMPTVMS